MLDLRILEGALLILEGALSSKARSTVDSIHEAARRSILERALIAKAITSQARRSSRRGAKLENLEAAQSQARRTKELARG